MNELNTGLPADPRVRKTDMITKFVAETLRARAQYRSAWIITQMRRVKRSSFEARLAGVGADGGGEIELDVSKLDDVGTSNQGLT